MNDYLVHGAQTIQCVSARKILVFAKIKGYRTCVVDDKLAYLQSDKPLVNKIFITNPAAKLELSSDECPEPLKLIYG